VRGADIATAIAALASRVTEALLESRPAAEPRREMARLEQDQRREAAERDAAERQARDAAEPEARLG
jgi:hypothetical protein